MLHTVGKQVYMLELVERWKIHNVFHVSLLEQDIIRKGHEFLLPGFEIDDDKNYKVETI